MSTSQGDSTDTAPLMSAFVGPGPTLEDPASPRELADVDGLNAERTENGRQRNERNQVKLMISQKSNENISHEHLPRFPRHSQLVY